MKAQKHTTIILPISIRTACALFLMVGLCALTFISNAQNPGWERYFDNGAIETGFGLVATDNGDYIVVGSTMASTPQSYAVRTDVDGFARWKKVFTIGATNELFSVVEGSDGGYVAAGYVTGIGNGEKDILLIKISEAGDIVWTQTYGTALDDRAYGLKRTPDGGYIITGSSVLSASNIDIVLLKTDAAGNQEWWKTFGDNGIDIGKSVDLTQDGGYILTGSYEVNPDSTDNINVFVIKTFANGSAEWQNTLLGSALNDEGYSIVTTTGGWYAVVGSYGSSNQVYFLRITEAGEQAGESFYGFAGLDELGYAIAETQDSGFIITGYSDETAADGKALLLRIDVTGQQLWLKRYGKPSGPGLIGINSGYTVLPTADGGFVVAGYGSSNVLGYNDDLFLFKTDSLGVTYTNYISGNVFADLNSDCQQDTGEYPFYDWLVEVSGPYDFYGTTDSLGNYSIPVDTGDYEVKVYPYPASGLWQPCQNYNVTVSGQYTTLELPFAAHPVAFCPYMLVDISTAFLRRCYDNVYSVNWCNAGTESAANATVDITFDQYLDVLDSSIPWVDQNGNTYTFALGDVAPGDCGTFQVTTFLNCDETVEGQTHCVTAHIYPDTLCLSAGPDWDGASIEINGHCEGDSVIFQLQNAGLMLTHPELEYIVIEDDILLRRDTIGTLGNGDILEIGFTAVSGSTYRMVAEQSPGHPGSDYPTVAIEGCQADSSGDFSIGYVTMFSENDGDPFVDIDCKESVDEYISNEKRAHPKGYHDAHYITDTTDLEYLIHFQNTTGAGVERVVVIDTLSDFLDVTTIEPGASSHPYSYEVYGNGILRFTFDNTGLPDSTSNEPGSHGFVKFRMSQKPGNPAGTHIRNRAAVYLDYFAPVFTNEIEHVVDTNFIMEVIVETTHPILPEANVKVYPNPFSESATFEIEAPGLRDIVFTLFSADGKAIRQQFSQEPQFKLERGNLPEGLYFFTIASKSQEVLVTGKIMIVRQ